MFNPYSMAKEAPTGNISNLIQNFLVFPDQLRIRDGANGRVTTSLPDPILSQCGSIQHVSSVNYLVNPTEPKRENSLPALPAGFILAPIRFSSDSRPVLQNRMSIAPHQMPQQMPQRIPAESIADVVSRKPEERERSSVSSSYSSGSDSESIEGTSEDENEGRMILIDDDKSFINVVWIRHYEELKRFKEVHHHTNVTRTRKESRKLGNWVAEQRRKKKQGRLNKNQILLLNACGFEWEKRKKRHTQSSKGSQDSSPLLPEISKPSEKASNEDVNALLSLGKW
eukprot:TRINITY_DN251_c0_g1_i4.p1 TRINITY_DN251_c0_g1~~TRINITY_DN251_c0_g1_i4.p1  ORF type:complete len:283 (-),score=76.07 TRINITY_DN251_c0_g1_i4:285-1133(-)